MATKDEENKSEASSTYSVSSTLIEKEGGKDTEIIYDSVDLLLKRILKANPILSETILSKCLKICYLFPKSYEFYMDDIIHMWIAQEFIPPVEVSNRTMEDTGRICFEEFIRMHVFQLSCPDSFTGRLRYTLNHSVFKLLQEEHDEGYTKLELKDIESPMSVNTLHLSLCYSYTDHDQIAINLKNFQSAEGLHTLLILHDRQRTSGLNNVPWDFFQKLPGLCVLDMSHTNITELPSSIGCLKQLRYLNLSCTPVTTLPNSLCSLYQMQTLKLRGCVNLIGLPKGMSELINLRHLDMDVSCLLLSMPSGIGDLAELQTLAAFVVGTQNGCRITELKNLANLRGTLSILRLENTTSSKEAKEAALDKKIYLDKLDLHWTKLRDGLELLENLQPHTQIQELEIVGYGGIKFPNWMGDPLFSKLSTISLHGCRRCELLPTLGKLPSLKSLCISDMDVIKIINHHFYGRNMDSKNSYLGGHELEAMQHNASMFNAFPGLENLTINAMNKLESWTGMEEGDFPRLQKLNISDCSMLTTLPELLLLSSLKQLEISLCPSLKSLPNGGLPTSLKYFVIIDCPLLKERCRKDEGQDWGKLIDIPNVWIDYEHISQVENFRAELQKRTQEVERHGLLTKLELSANMIEEDEKRMLETATLQARFDQLHIMDDCKLTTSVVEEEENVITATTSAVEEKENVITATQNFVRALEANGNLTASMKKIIEDLNVHLSTMNVQSESKQGIGKIEKQLSSVEEKITRWESDHSMIWESLPEAASEYLQAVEEVRKLAECLEGMPLDGDENVKELFRRTHGVLQIAMARLEEEFSNILSQNKQSFEPEHMSFRSYDDSVHDFSGISIEYEQVEDSLPRDSSSRVSLFQNKQTFEPEHMFFRSFEDDSIISSYGFSSICEESVQSDISSQVSEDSFIPNVIPDLKCIENVMIEYEQVEDSLQRDSSSRVSVDSLIDWFHPNYWKCIAGVKIECKQVEDSLPRDSSSRLSVDPLIDLVHPNVIPVLKCIADVMIASSYDQECCQAYIRTRKEALDECLFQLEVEKMSIEEVIRMDWSNINVVIKKWLKAMKTFTNLYLPSEKQLCEQIFGDISSVSSYCFLETSKPSILRLLSFGEAIAIGPLSPEKLFRILDMYEVLSDLLPRVDDLFMDEVGSFIKTEYHDVLKRLGDCVVGTFSEFENAVGSNQSTAPFAGGGIHHLTKYVMNYIKFFIDYSDTFNFLLRSHNGEGSVSMLPKLNSVDEKNKGESSSYCFTPIAHRLRSVTITLESNLKIKSNLYKDGALQHFFLMNNIHYMVQKVKSSELRAFFGDDWIRQHNWKFQQEAMNYERSTWSSVLIILRDDGISQGSNSATRTVLKERFKSFNVAFDEVYKNQTGWLIHDPHLREDLRISASLKVIQAYRTFLGRHASQLGLYVKYSADDLQNYLLDFFEGSPRSLHISRKG